MLEAAAGLIERTLLRHGKDREVYGLVHADFVPDNLFEQAGRIVVLDFDDAGYGWYLWGDLGLALQAVRGSRTPATDDARCLVDDMKRRGVLISTIGPHGNVLKMRPPMVFASDHAGMLIETLEQALTDGGMKQRT